MKDYCCMTCGEPLEDYEPKMCCDGRECGCMGMPTEPPVCSSLCWDLYVKSRDLRGILKGYGWINVPQYTTVERSDDWEAEYKKLLQHHVKETTAIIYKTRELAQELLDQLPEPAYNDPDLAVSDDRKREVLKEYGWSEFYDSNSWIHESWVDQRKPYDRMAMPMNVAYLSALASKRKEDVRGSEHKDG